MIELLLWFGVIICGIITGCGLAYLLVAILYMFSNQYGDTRAGFDDFTGRYTLRFITKQDLKENPRGKKVSNKN